MPFKNIIILGFSLLLLIFLGATSSSAIASSNLSARVLRLESDLFQVRSQLNRLDGQVDRLARGLESQRLESQRQSQSAANSPESPPSSPRPQRAEPTPEEQFDKLATLAIELRQQLEQLEVRVVRLESL